MLAVFGWGKEGHEIVGNLAYKLLSNNTKTMIYQILAMTPPSTETNNKNDKDPNSPLGAIADWADTVRHTSEYHWSGPLHYIDIHDDAVNGGCPVFHRTTEEVEECHFDYARDCANDFCVAGAIVNYTAYLSEWKKQQFVPQKLRGSNFLLKSQSLTTTATPLPAKLVQDSLKFLTHFVGDIHQPLHSARATDKGGNSIDVEFNDRGSHQMSRDHRYDSHRGWELHAVWDTGIIERALYRDYKGSRLALESELLDYIVEADKTGELRKWLRCPDTRHPKCTTIWAEESWQNALQWAYTNSDKNETEVVSGTHLSEIYYETRLVQIKHLLAVAGVRLAVSLEIALGGSSSSNNPALFQ